MTVFWRISVSKLAKRISTTPKTSTTAAAAAATTTTELV